MIHFRYLRTALLPLALAACAGAPAHAPSAAPRASTPIDRELALATFDSAWSRINNTYYDPGFRGLDWRAVRDELRPRAESARTEQELRATIGDMLERIGDSHFGLIPREAADAVDPDSIRAGSGGPPADAGIELRLVGGELVVTRVHRAGASEAAGVRPGWAIERIGDREVGGWLEALNRIDGEAERQVARAQLIWRAGSLLQGTAETSVRVRFLDGSNRRVERDLVLRPIPGEPVRFGNLPTFLAHLEHEQIPLGSGCVGLIRFNIWMTPINAAFERAVEALAGCDGIVLDLRGNPGGVGGMVMGTSGFFVDEVVPLGVMRTRQGELRFVSNPRRSTRAGAPTRPYAGPLAILIDPMSMSTSEIFATGMQEIGRARLFGETTGGQALPALMVRLPNQDVLLHAFADFVGPLGERIEGRGAVPDHPVTLDRAALIAGRDAPLDAAVEWIRSQRPSHVTQR